MALEYIRRKPSSDRPKTGNGKDVKANKIYRQNSRQHKQQRQSRLGATLPDPITIHRLRSVPASERLTACMVYPTFVRWLADGWAFDKKRVPGGLMSLIPARRQLKTMVKPNLGWDVHGCVRLGVLLACVNQTLAHHRVTCLICTCGTGSGTVCARHHQG